MFSNLLLFYYNDSIVIVILLFLYLQGSYYGTRKPKISLNIYQCYKGSLTVQLSTTKFSKPPHKKCVLHCLDEVTYSKYANLYASCKRWGVRGIYAFVTGTGLYGVVKELAQGTVIQYGKRRLSLVVIGAASYVCAPAVAVITNATRVVKTCKVVYTSVGYIVEAVEDASQLTFLPLDLVLFGQPIPANQGGRYSCWSKITDLIDSLPGLD